MILRFTKHISAARIVSLALVVAVLPCPAAFGQTVASAAVLAPPDSIHFGQYANVGIAMSGDNIFVGRANYANNSGAAHVFGRTETGWHQSARLDNPDPGQTWLFGRHIAVSGDTAVVTSVARLSDYVPATAFVFVRSQSGDWQLQARLEAGFFVHPQAPESEIASVAIEGDTIAFGAGSFANNQGSVYVFTRSGGEWTQQARLRPVDLATRFFGSSLAISGDTLIVGSRWDSPNNISNAGAAYIYTRDGSSWSRQAYLKSPRPNTEASFGLRVDVSGDIAVVSDSFGHDANRVSLAHVFVREGMSWTLQTSLSGGSRAKIIDNDLIAQGDSSANDEAGAINLFSRKDGTWSQDAKVENPNLMGEPTLYFGSAFELERGTLLAKAILPAEPNTSQPTAVYVMDLNLPSTNLADPRVTSVFLDTSRMFLRFSAEAGITEWKVMGSADLETFADDRTADSTIQELSPGNYEASVELGETRPPHYFLRLHQQKRE